MMCNEKGLLNGWLIGLVGKMLLRPRSCLSFTLREEWEPGRVIHEKPSK
jgi:hypothetical protein